MDEVLTRLYILVDGEKDIGTTKVSGSTLRFGAGDGP